MAIKETEKKEEKVVKPAPNLAFIGEEGTKPLVTIQTAARHGIRLPEDQSKPFYHEKAVMIARTFPHLYKPVVGKGAK